MPHDDEFLILNEDALYKWDGRLRFAHSEQDTMCSIQHAACALLDHTQVATCRWSAREGHEGHADGRLMRDSVRFSAMRDSALQWTHSASQSSDDEQDGARQ